MRYSQRLKVNAVIWILAFASQIQSQEDPIFNDRVFKERNSENEINGVFEGVSRGKVSIRNTSTTRIHTISINRFTLPDQQWIKKAEIQRRKHEQMLAKIEHLTAALKRNGTETSCIKIMMDLESYGILASTAGPTILKQYQRAKTSEGFRYQCFCTWGTVVEKSDENFAKFLRPVSEESHELYPLILQDPIKYLLALSSFGLQAIPLLRATCCDGTLNYSKKEIEKFASFAPVDLDSADELANRIRAAAFFALSRTQFSESLKQPALKLLEKAETKINGKIDWLTIEAIIASLPSQGRFYSEYASILDKYDTKFPALVKQVRSQLKSVNAELRYEIQQKKLAEYRKFTMKKSQQFFYAKFVKFVGTSKVRLEEFGGSVYIFDLQDLSQTDLKWIDLKRAKTD